MKSRNDSKKRKNNDTERNQRTKVRGLVLLTLVTFMMGNILGVIVFTRGMGPIRDQIFNLDGGGGRNPCSTAAKKDFSNWSGQNSLANNLMRDTMSCWSYLVEGTWRGR